MMVHTNQIYWCDKLLSRGIEPRSSTLYPSHYTDWIIQALDWNELSKILKTQWNRTVLLRTRFTTLWRCKIHSKNRRRRRFGVRRKKNIYL